MELTHFNAEGHAHMVDVGDKASSERRARATGTIVMQPETLVRICDGRHKKGDVLAVARIAAIMAAKKTAEVIPLCHPIVLTHVDVEFTIQSTLSAVQITVCTECQGQTGVEMEALTAVNIGLLTIYDMCKAVDRGMRMQDICLLEKSGGKSGAWQAND